MYSKAIFRNLCITCCINGKWAHKTTHKENVAPLPHPCTSVVYFCGMHVLLCAATQLELQATEKFLKAHPLPVGVQVQLLVTGVGILPSTYQLTKYLAANKPGLVLQAGIGGSFDQQLALCHTVVIGSDTVADAGVMENNQFNSLFDLRLANSNQPPWTEGKLVNPHTQLLQQTGLPIAHSITVNEISTHNDRIRYYRQHWHAQLESMEGAALHYVCLLEQIPFLQIRTVSNYVGERNKANWKLQESIEQLNKAVQQLLFKLFPL